MIAVNVAYTGDADGFCTSDDRVTMGVQAATHWDALAHVGYSGELYNGVPDTVVTEAGAASWASTPSARWPPEASSSTWPACTASTTSTTATPSPATTWTERPPPPASRSPRRHRPGPHRPHALPRASARRTATGRSRPGLSTQSIDWIHDHDLAGVATDTLVLECFPCEDPHVLLPVHMIHLRDLGLAQGQLWHLDDLAADCAADGQHDLLLTATPIPLTRGCGGMVAPTAVK